MLLKNSFWCLVYWSWKKGQIFLQTIINDIMISSVIIFVHQCPCRPKKCTFTPHYNVRRIWYKWKSYGSFQFDQIINPKFKYPPITHFDPPNTSITHTNNLSKILMKNPLLSNTHGLQLQNLSLILSLIYFQMYHRVYVIHVNSYRNMP